MKLIASMKAEKFNEAYSRMAKSPQVVQLGEMYVEMMLYAATLETQLAQLRAGISVPVTTTETEKPPRRSNDEIIAGLREKFPGLLTTEAEPPAMEAGALDYRTPEGLEALKKRWGLQ